MNLLITPAFRAVPQTGPTDIGSAVSAVMGSAVPAAVGSAIPTAVGSVLTHPAAGSPAFKLP